MVRHSPGFSGGRHSRSRCPSAANSRERAASRVRTSSTSVSAVASGTSVVIVTRNSIAVRPSSSGHCFGDEPSGPRRPVTLRISGLPHLDQITVGIADVATDLVLVLLGRRQELSTPGTPFLVDGCDVFDPDIEEAAD